MTDFKIIIPARYDSKRLPGKLLLDLAGKPVLWHVYQKALKAKAKEVFIATGDQVIIDYAQSIGANVVKTSNEHESGTDRVAEAVVKLGWKDDEIVVNVQGDQPLLSPTLVQFVADALSENKSCEMATVAKVIDQEKDYLDSNVAKVVVNKNSEALYFSRAPIPFDRDGIFKKGFNQFPIYYHLGLYAYRIVLLKEYQKWGVSELEKIEKLEQLRFLWQGKKIHLAITKEKIFPEVNTLADLELVRSLL
jgi:3-deoxy-manno-octulosonate cytidylyltransferase (CMP-KDO synthetase)